MNLVNEKYGSIQASVTEVLRARWLVTSELGCANALHKLKENHYVGYNPNLSFLLTEY